jgi:hypothetical protein
MITCEFRMAGDNTVVGTKELDHLPQVEDEVTIEGRTYLVEECPDKPSSSDPTVVCVRRPFGI